MVCDDDDDDADDDDEHSTDTYLVLWLLYVFDDIKDVNFGVQQAWVST